MTFCERNDLSNCVLRQTRTDIFNNISKTWCLRNQSAVRCNLARINLAIDNGTYLTLQSSRSFAGLLRNRGNGGKKKKRPKLKSQINTVNPTKKEALYYKSLGKPIRENLMKAMWRSFRGVFTGFSNTLGKRMKPVDSFSYHWFGLLSMSPVYYQDILAENYLRKIK